MTNKKISDLPSALSVGVTDEIEIVQAGVSMRATVAKVNATPIPLIPVPFSSIQPIAASTLVGRGSAGGTGPMEEITLGTGLTMTGTTLDASGGGGSTSFGDGWNWATDPSNLSFVSPQSDNTYLVLSDDVDDGVGLAIATSAGTRIDTFLGGCLLTANNTAIEITPDRGTQITGPSVLISITDQPADTGIWGWESDAIDGVLFFGTYSDVPTLTDIFLRLDRTATTLTSASFSAPSTAFQADLFGVFGSTQINLTTSSGTITLQSNADESTTTSIIMDADITISAVGSITTSSIVFEADAVDNWSATSGNNLSMSADNNVTVTAASALLLQATNGSATLSAPSSFVNLSSPTVTVDANTITLATDTTRITTTTAGNGISIEADNINFQTTTDTGVGAAGAGSALPATPTGYLWVKINNSNFQIPYYARA